jgi:hypothetical protein
MTILELLVKKRSEVRLYRDEIFSEEEDPGWAERHKLGPVHVRIRCRLCDKVLRSDLKEFGWLEKDEFYKKHLLPHQLEH